MFQTTLQNDTLLNQLKQDVEIKSTHKINLPRKLIQLPTIRSIDSISRRDSISRATFENTTQHLPKKLTEQPYQRQEVKLLDSLIPINAEEVTLYTEKAQQPDIVLPEKVMTREKLDWFLGIFILVFILLASIRMFFNKYLNQLFYAIVNYTTSSRLFRESSLSLTHASFRLDLIFYFIFSMFIYQLFDRFHILSGQSGFLTYLIILGMVSAYFILKRLAYYLTAIASESMSETAEFLYNINIHNRILGLFLIPVTLVLAFASLENPRLVVLLGVSICVIFYFLLLFRGAKILISKHFSIFYLILYLCTLEILPLIFIYNMVLVKNGI